MVFEGKTIRISIPDIESKIIDAFTPTEEGNIIVNKLNETNPEWTKNDDTVDALQCIKDCVCEIIRKSNFTVIAIVEYQDSTTEHRVDDLIIGLIDDRMSSLLIKGITFNVGFEDTDSGLSGYSFEQFIFPHHIYTTIMKEMVEAFIYYTRKILE